MKEFIEKELTQIKEPKLKRLALAEIIQHFVLQNLFRQNAFKYLTFTGGTALRLLYHTGRYSEDLDFSLTGKSNKKLEKLFTDLQKDFGKLNLDFELFQKERKSIYQADLRFPKILQKFNLSPLKDQKLTIKIEIDKIPPKGGNEELMLVASPISYKVLLFDLPSLFATKLCAIFFRKYTKGRDYYDLMWFLGKKIKPNFLLLNNAIKQIKPQSEKITEENFKEKLISHFKQVDFKKIRFELGKFIISEYELEFISFEALSSLLKAY